MTPAIGTSADISRKAWLLAQHIGYTTKSEFARAMGWDPSRFSRTLSGDRQWTLDDLHTLADALGLDGPGDLFRPLSELSALLDDRQRSIKPLTTGQYDPATATTDLQLDLITDAWSDYQSVSCETQDAVMIPTQRRAGVTRPGPTPTGENADAA